eukprot:Plantae.Rhodophyta-Rhodochaete_pulchella.ctg8004.p2 GENE.Plantae.Rhodophyta-Rhodochaete_pulchella.ctg8004~~Plantae.Rhodophyta-Rhodochaete_pulchella.ctg8004.p2  ORF type:complete len:374 (+),score=31.99 Plantae.Rhodophyta-Rhodochaete_pulchella.ctg8004:609-1730(+)
MGNCVGRRAAITSEHVRSEDSNSSPKRKRSFRRQNSVACQQSTSVWSTPSKSSDTVQSLSFLSSLNADLKTIESFQEVMSPLEPMSSWSGSNPEAVHDFAESQTSQSLEVLPTVLSPHDPEPRILLKTMETLQGATSQQEQESSCSGSITEAGTDVVQGNSRRLQVLPTVLSPDEPELSIILKNMKSSQDATSQQAQESPSSGSVPAATHVVEADSRSLQVLPTELPPEDPELSILPKTKKSLQKATSRQEQESPCSVCLPERATDVVEANSRSLQVLPSVVAPDDPERSVLLKTMKSWQEATSRQEQESPCSGIVPEAAARDSRSFEILPGVPFPGDPETSVPSQDTIFSSTNKFSTVPCWVRWRTQYCHSS